MSRSVLKQTRNVYVYSRESKEFNEFRGIIPNVATFKITKTDAYRGKIEKEVGLYDKDDKYLFLAVRVKNIYKTNSNEVKMWI